MEALNDFEIYLTDLPRSEEGSFAIGRENFDYMLKHQYFMDISSDSLLIIGQKLLAETQAAYTEYEAYVEEQHQNGADSVYVPASFDRSDILSYYGWEVEQVKGFLTSEEIVTVPDDIGAVEIIETPAFLRSMFSGIAYQQAAPFDSARVGIFYVRPVPDDLGRIQLEARYRYVHRRGFRGSVVHEAFPGHHLQMQIAGQNDDLIRRSHQNNMFIEGWALYCEEMTYHRGLYGQEDPAQWLAVLDGILFRAARVVADVKLHTGQFTYSECVDWMIDQLNIESESGRNYIRTEVRRYTMTPTYQMSYLMGKQEIMKLRQALEAREGDDFSEMDFHDALLAEGAIPPVLFWYLFELK
ncbi:MAG: DUF885 domain-containing protein, partial [candidate division Zixibacteria bacterium]